MKSSDCSLTALALVEAVNGHDREAFDALLDSVDDYRQMTLHLAAAFAVTMETHPDQERIRQVLREAAFASARRGN